MQANQSIFSSPVRWTLGVLSWLAFGIAAYLAWHVDGSSVAGCGVGGHNGCNIVLSSSWSKWLGVPVAVLGLACYATLAALSVLLAIQSSASRWIITAFALMATLAAGASLWFIALQIFVIGDFCLFCLATDICGIAIGTIAGWCAYRWWSGTPGLRYSGRSSTAHSALRSAIPANARVAPVAATPTAPTADLAETTLAVPRTTSTSRARTVPVVGSVASSSSRRTFSASPSMPIAYGGALALLLLLIGGQFVFPSKTYEVGKASLPNSVDLSAQSDKNASAESPSGVEPHVTMRINTEDTTEPTDQKAESTAATPGNGPSTDASGDGTTEATATESPPEPKRERKIKLLGGKLTLDVGDEPIIGSVDAPHVVVEMVSYNCSHCRKTNRLMKKAMSRYGDQVALVVLILPLEGRCNRLVTDPAASHSGACTTARTAIALAKLKPTSFSRFHEFLMSGDEKKPPELTGILAKAYQLADSDQLQSIRDTKEVEKKVASYVDLYELLRRHSPKGKKEFGMPIQILGDHIMSGSVEKVDDLYKAWEEHLGVKPR